MPTQYVDESTWQEAKYQEQLYAERAKNDREWKSMQDGSFQYNFGLLVIGCTLLLFLGGLAIGTLERAGVRFGVSIRL